MEVEGLSCPAEATPLPEILKASTESRAPQSDNGIGAGDGPVHACALETRADDHFAARLDNPCGSAQSLRFKGWILHPVTVAMDVLQAFPRLSTVIRVSANGSQ